MSKDETYSFYCPHCGGEKLVVVGEKYVKYAATSISINDQKIEVKHGDTPLKADTEDCDFLHYICDFCGEVWKSNDDLIAAGAVINELGYSVDYDGKEVPDDLIEDEEQSWEDEL